MANPENIPYFIQVRGCINCHVSKAMKEKNGTEYGFDHELIAGCLLHDCFSLGHDLTTPFIDPEEFIRFAQEHPSPETNERAREILDKYKETYDAYFKQIGVNIDDLIKTIS